MIVSTSRAVPTTFHRFGRQHRARTGLRIEIAAAIGTAPTELAAFDAALRAVGVGDVNLIRLSSVIPPRSTLTGVDQVRQEFEWGDRLYCVYAEQHASVPGQQAAAGIGWIFRDDDSGAGLFVEHEADTKAEVEDLIENSLADMAAHRPGTFTAPQMRVVTATCSDQPVCALVLAAYRSAGWYDR